MPVTREEVIWCYQTLLGREAESDEATSIHLSHNDFRALVAGFTSSEEFKAKNIATRWDNRQDAIGSFLPVNLPKQRIDVEASEQQLAQCFAKVKITWEHLGQTRAHHSVLTDKDFLPENFAGSAQRFWASGDEEVAIAEAVLARHGRDDVSGMTAIEYGCGVGRLSTAFGKRFKHADCFDISEPHLAYARKRAKEVNAKRVSFHRAVAETGFGLPPCDFFYSSIVFQHNPPPLITELIRSALRCLRSNGVAIFQVPTYIAGYKFDLSNWLRTDHELDMQMHCVPQSLVYSLIREEGCTLLEIRENGAAGRPDLILSNVFVVEKTR